jgi:hypothetical protein
MTRTRKKKNFKITNMINLKGFRKITVDGIQYHFKCKSHEKTVVAAPDNKFFYLTASNSSEVNSMSLPSVVSAKIREYRNQTHVTVYHGTNAQCANLIKHLRVLKSEGLHSAFGAGVCRSIQQALNFSAIKTIRFGKLARNVGRIVKFQVPYELLKSASKEHVPEAFTLNHPSGKPIREYHIEGDIEVLTIPQAQKLAK